MLTIYLHGYLNELHPEPIKVFANSVAEAITALKNYAGFDPRKGHKHTVAIDGIHTQDALYERTELTEIHVRPVVFAAGGGGGFFQMVIGALLIVAAFLLPVSPLIATALISAGISMMLGGLLQMLMPQPKLEGIGENELKSQYLGARGNTVAIGTTIPMIFGRHKAWGHYLSFDVDSTDLNAAPESWYSSPFTDNGETTYSAAPEEVPSLDPQEESGLPVGAFTSFNEATSVFTFTPAIDLPQGQIDVTFANGRSLHALNTVSGVTNYVTILSGNTTDLPANGTAIVFTQNYV